MAFIKMEQKRTSYGRIRFYMCYILWNSFFLCVCEYESVMDWEFFVVVAVVVVSFWDFFTFP